MTSTHSSSATGSAHPEPAAAPRRSSRRWLWGFLAAALVTAGLAGGGAWWLLSLQEQARHDDFQRARNLLAQGETARALSLVGGHLEATRGTEPWLPDALALQFEAHEAAGATDEARAAAQRLVELGAAAAGPHFYRAHAWLGQQALEQNQPATAREHFEAVLAQEDPQGSGADVAALGLLRLRLASAGATPELQAELEALLERFPDSPLREEMEFVLGEVNMALLLSPYPGPEDRIYTVQRGDTIVSIGDQFGVPWELLLRVNQIHDPKRLSVGRRLKIPSVDFSIVVDKTNNALVLQNQGEFFKRYRVRTGQADYMTPTGEYKVLTKKKNPQWTDPRTGNVYPPNHPENQLGTRWMGFQGSSLGIHGTIDPESIGQYASNGCVGMLREDVEELFDLVPRGTPIRIVGQIQKESLASNATP